MRQDSSGQAERSPGQEMDDIWSPEGVIERRDWTTSILPDLTAYCPSPISHVLQEPPMGQMHGVAELPHESHLTNRKRSLLERTNILLEL